MSYLVLARKYRPRSFAEMVGQAHVVQALGNALTQQRLHHAYLFTGTRGVGKTTVSRILAKSLNCVGADGNGGITATPCGVCSACRDIDAGRHVDYVELDAASNRGVEEISQLLDQAVYKPVVGRFKVYMIDEVHMLSATAFNAMLKTLEEPPEYLKFVLATTDPQKVPVTVLSRCLQFNLRPMATDTIVEHLQSVLQAEAVEFDTASLRLIARGARGSMRDALSLTDQAIAYAGGHLAEAAVRQMLGAVDRSHVVRIVEALGAGDGVAMVRTVDDLRGLGLSAAGTLEELAHLAQQMAVLQAVPAAVDRSQPDAAQVEALAGLLPPDETQLIYSVALHGRAELALAPDEYAGLLMVLLRLLAFRPEGQGRGLAPVQRTSTTASAPAGSAALVAAPQDARATVRTLAPSSMPAAADSTRAAPVTSKLPPSPPAAAVPRFADVARRAEAVAPGAAAEPAIGHGAAVAPWDDEPPWVRDEVPGGAAEQGGEAVPERVDAGAGTDESDPAVQGATAAAHVVSGEAGSDAADPTARMATDRWIDVIRQLLARGAVTGLVRELAWQAECARVDDSGDVVTWSLRVERESLRQNSHRERLQTALTELLDRTQRIDVAAGEARDSAARRDAAAKAQAQVEADQLIQDDPLVQQLFARFPSARIVPGSIRPR